MTEATKNYFDKSKLATFRELESQVPGFFSNQNAALWDTLVCFQKEYSLFGSMLEIGVYKGRSALIPSLHLRDQEKFFLIDGSAYIEEAQKHLNLILDSRGYYIQKMSYDLKIDSFTNISNFSITAGALPDWVSGTKILPVDEWRIKLKKAVSVTRKGF